MVRRTRRATLFAADVYCPRLAASMFAKKRQQMDGIPLDDGRGSAKERQDPAIAIPTTARGLVPPSHCRFPDPLPLYRKELGGEPPKQVPPLGLKSSVGITARNKGTARRCARPWRINTWVSLLRSHRFRSRFFHLAGGVELLEVLGEARGEIGGHLVVGGLVLPRIARIQQLRGNARDRTSECVNPKDGSTSNSTLARLPSTSAFTMARV